MKHKQFDFRTAYIDLLLNILTGIIFLFVLTTLMIQPKKNDDGIKRNAEFLIIAEWDDAADCDVDLWVQDPLNNIAWFQAKDVGLMHLERDSLGFHNNVIKDSTGKVLYKVSENKETTVLRGIIPGEYTVNVHLYSCKNLSEKFTIGQEANIPVKVTLIKLNPTFKTITSNTKVLKRVWNEETMFNFLLSSSGNVDAVSSNFKNLVRSVK